MSSQTSTPKILIPEPCKADWSGMQPVKGGRHCRLCDKAVVDFTGMEPEEIRDYFARHIGEKTCGRFRTAQVAAQTSLLQRLYSKAERRISQRAFSIIPLSLITLLMTLSGCSWFTMGESGAETEQEQMLIGDTIAVQQSIPLKGFPDTIAQGPK